MCPRIYRDFVIPVAVLCMLCTGAPVLADGYRPPTRFAGQFLDSLPQADIVVFPTVVRDPILTRYSRDSRDLAIRLLTEYDVANVYGADQELHLGKAQGMSQFELFESSVRAMADELRAAAIDADYFMLIEVLFPPDQRRRLEVFGIHVYVVTPAGENVFSVILNSHHESFSSARLRSNDPTARGKEELAVRATQVAIEALQDQIADARACAAREAGRTPIKPESDVIDDFDNGLPRGNDEFDVQVGFSTFRGPDSRVQMATTDRHPSLPGEDPGNSVLEIRLNVKSWAGVMHRFANDRADEWVSYDWRGAVELSFWIHGLGTGTTLVIDVLDNRNPCSTFDDAERYSYTFPDSFRGWQLVSIPLEVMTRKDIGNGAPNDGLGLGRVHGWGIAALNTDGARRYWIDDVRLRRTPLLSDLPPALGRDRNVWVPVNELPMFGGFERTERQKQADDQFIATVLPEYDNDRELAAEQWARQAWKYVYNGDYPTAIKRFNQAWLLDPENATALWGFAAISRHRGRSEAALQYYEMAIEMGAEWPKLRAEYEQLRDSLIEDQRSP